MSPAEFRGPGARHSFDHDSPDEYDLDIHRHRGYGGRNGRIILLGNGTEVLTDSTDDTEMFDHSMDDDKDEEDQIKQGSSTTNDNDSTRNEREGTPGPQTATEGNKGKGTMGHTSVSHGPETSIKGVADTPRSK